MAPRCAQARVHQDGLVTFSPRFCASRSTMFPFRFVFHTQNEKRSIQAQFKHASITVQAQLTYANRKIQLIYSGLTIHAILANLNARASLS